MGIIAYCPRGHRLKLKDELAGRKGICPQCGDRFRIPYESQNPPPTDSADGPTAGTSPRGLPVASVVSLDADLAATLPRALPLASDPHDA